MIRRPSRLVVIAVVGAFVAAVSAVVLQGEWRSMPWFDGGARSTVAEVHSSGEADHPTTTGDGVVSEYDGVVPDGVTPFNDEFAAVANLDPDLLDAVRDAAEDAADDGVTFYVNSGWRSAEYQVELLREAVAQYGSIDEAARWVATPETSAHVSGDAVDIGSYDAAEWLAEQGVNYGLCRTYRNEPWHFELRPDSIGRRCPRMFSDPTEDPRMETR